MASRVVDFILNIKGDAVDKAGDLSDNLDDVEKSATPAKSGLLGVAGAVAAVSTAALAAAKGLFEMRDAQVAVVDEINTMANAAGSSNQLMKALDQTARSTGKSLSDLVPRDLAKKTLDAANGLAKARRAFEQVGISADSLVKADGSLKGVDELLPDIIDNLKRIPDRATRSGVAMQLLGTQGQQLLTAFGDSKELLNFIELTSKFGTDVGPEAVKAAGEWQKATGNLSLAFEDAKSSILSTFGDDLFVDFMRGASFAMVFVGRLAQNIAKEVGDVWDVTVDQIVDNLLIAIQVFRAVTARDLPKALELAQTFDHTSLAERLMDGFGDAAADAFRDAVEFDILSQGGMPDRPTGIADQDAAEPFKVLFDDKTARSVADAVRDALDDAESWADLDASMAAIPEAVRELAAGMPTRRDLQNFLFANAIESANAALGSVDSLLRSVNFFGLGDLAATVIAVARDIDTTIESLLNEVLSIPNEIGSSIERLLREVIPSFIRAIPDLIVDILVDLPLAIARGIFLGIPAIIEAVALAVFDIVKTLLDIGGAVVGAVDSIMGFLLGPWWETIKEFFGKAFGKIGDFFSNILDGAVVQWFVQGFQAIWGEIRDFFAGLLEIGGGNGLLVGQEGNVLGTNLRRNQGDVKVFGVNVPGFESGGFSTRTGLALLHEGERVVPKTGANTGSAGRGMGGISIGTVNVKANNPREFLRELETFLGDFGTGETFRAFKV